MKIRKLSRFAPYYVYQHIRLDNNEVFYIGIGTQRGATLIFERAHSLHNRNKYWRRIVGKVGYRVEIIIIDYDYNIVKNCERKLVAELGKRIEHKGLLVNLADGGNNGHPQTQETREKISIGLRKAYKENPVDWARIWEDRTQYNCKPIIQYTLDKIFIKEHRSINDAAKHSGVNREAITHTLQRGIGNRSGNFLWSYKNENIDNMYRKPNYNSKPVLQYTFSGEVVREYNSLSEAVRVTKFSNIYSCVKGTTKSAGGYIWKYKEVSLAC